jgi:hypothetical protein
MNSRPWTKEEVEYFKKEYGNTPTHIICATTNRTLRAIHRKAVKLGLKIHKLDPIDYFMRRIVILENDLNNSPCWHWIGTISPEGYGRFWLGNVRAFAHRWAYEYFVLKIPQGLVIDHLCRNHSCVNPAHMEVVTNRENIARGISPFAAHIRRIDSAKAAQLNFKINPPLL